MFHKSPLTLFSLFPCPFNPQDIPETLCSNFSSNSSQHRPHSQGNKFSFSLCTELIGLYNDIPFTSRHKQLPFFVTICSNCRCNFASSFPSCPSSSFLSASLHTDPHGHLKGVDNWSFDVFALGAASNDQVLKYLGYDLMNRYGFIHKFKVICLHRSGPLFHLSKIYSQLCNNINMLHFLIDFFTPLSLCST